jgi:hypothetical protein
MNDPYETAEERRARVRQEKAAKAKLALDNAVIQNLMNTVAGRGWMRELLEATHIFHSSYTGEALSSAFKEGERCIGLRILAEVMRACPQAYIQMMMEQSDGRADLPVDRRDPDDDRNYDTAGRWIGDGEGPEQ